jgi:prepilin-type N-terminal cleavage/methylation domain-containing protein
MIQPKRSHLFLDRQLKLSLISRSAAAHQGFTLSEVIVSILLIATFVSVALQGMVVAMVLKSRSAHLAEADRWVQTDLESIRAQINTNSLPLADYRSQCQPTSADRGFADVVRDRVAGVDVTGTADYTLPPQLVTSKTGKVFKITRTLTIPATPENSRYKILGIQYLVAPTTGNQIETPILQLYAEAIPDAAFQCQ